MKLLWEESAWEEYTEWQIQDKKTLKRINALIKDIQRNLFEGIGKPEALKGNFHTNQHLSPHLIFSKNYIIYDNMFHYSIIFLYLIQHSIAFPKDILPSSTI